MEEYVGTKNLRTVIMAVVAAVGLLSSGPADAFRAPELSTQEQKTLRENFTLCVGKLKGPYTENFCVCPGGEKRPVRSASGALGTGCKDPIFCAAYRAPWAEALAKNGVYIANVFSRDLYLWDTFPDHNDLVRGYVLEQYFVATNPTHKFAELRAFRGLASAEEQAPAAANFFERYLTAPEFNDSRDFLLAYELQKRYFFHADLGQIEKIRAIAVRVQAADPRFKPLRDAVHNQMSARLIPDLAAYRDKLPPGATRAEVDEMIAEITKLTSTDESALVRQVGEVQDAPLRAKLGALVPTPKTAAVDAVSS
ncbi:MAG TPA: hypothetical protein VMS22_16110, partial [Candidatus Eisenbacteria bacterium]|nr:hypothetical protein [Candidatus Eisenbacteria bacterium]